MERFYWIILWKKQKILDEEHYVLKGIQKKATGLRPIAFIYFMYCPFYIRFLLVSLLKIKNL